MQRISTLFIALLLGVDLRVGFASGLSCSGGLGGTLFGSGSIEVSIRPGNPTAIYTSDLYIALPGQTPVWCGTSRTIGITTRIDDIPANTELTFYIFVRNTGDTYRIGPSARNPDGVAHAIVNCVSDGLVEIGFEDLRGGGDLSYNDIIFQVKALCNCGTVPRLSQGDPAWAADLYANSSTLTIQNKGCALTSLSMALNYAGVIGWFQPDINGNPQFVLNTPGTLNALFKTFGGYSGLSVDWGTATKVAANRSLTPSIKFNATRIASSAKVVSDQAKKYLDRVVCEQGFPVIVAVDGASHFVVVTGKEGERYTIADPGYVGRTYLDAYNSFETRGYVADPPADTSEADFSCSSLLNGVRFQVINDEGFITGKGEDSIFEQILNSVCFMDAISDDVTGAPAGEGSQFVHIFQPGTGRYQVRVDAGRAIPFRIVMNSVAIDGTLQLPNTLVGIAGPSITTTFDVTFNPTPGAKPSVKRKASLVTLLADIVNAETLGFVSNAGVAKSLKSKVLAAQNACSKGDLVPSANILRALRAEVLAQNSLSITSELTLILTEDIDDIIGDPTGCQ